MLIKLCFLFFLSFTNNLATRRVITFPTASTYSNNGAFLWKIGKRDDFRKGQLKKLIFQGYPICVTRDVDNGSICAISDICIHRAASLSNGKVLSNGCVQCPYHGWEFKHGLVSAMPGCPEKQKGVQFGVPRFEVKEMNGDVYLCPTYDVNSEYGVKSGNTIYIPEEAHDKSFTRVSGVRHVDRPHSLITENVLDMMHVSFVHSFGNRLSPVPFDVQYEDIDDYSGKTTFHYTAGSMSMSSVFGKAQFVKVENEFYLPDTTVTRVFANNIVKTIVTHAYPIGKNESILHYDLYRNFLTSPLFDVFFQYQMERTLDEDVEILTDIYDVYQKGFMNTKYDITQMNYRKKFKNISENNTIT